MIKTYTSSFEITKSVPNPKFGQEGEPKYIKEPYIFIGIDSTKHQEFIDKYGDFRDDEDITPIDAKNSIHCVVEHPTLGFSNSGGLDDPLYFYSGSMILRLDNEYHLPLSRILNNFEYGDLNISIFCNVGGEKKLWTGFIEPVTGGTNVDDFPYEIQIDYHDGLGKLGEEDFVLTFGDETYSPWDGYWGDAESSSDNGYAMPITQLFDYCCRIAGINLQNIYYKQAIVVYLAKFVYKDTGKEFYNNLNTICVPKGFLSEEDSHKNSLSLMNDVLRGLGLQGFIFGGSLILFPLVDNNPNQKFVKLTKRNAAQPISFFGSSLRPNMNTFHVSAIGDDDLVDWIPHRARRIAFNTDGSAITYVEKGDVYTSREVAAAEIEDNLKSEKDAVKLGTSRAHFDVFGTLVGGGVSTTKSKSPNIKDKKIDGFIIESTTSQSYRANSADNENYVLRRYRFTIPRPDNLIGDANDVFTIKLKANGVLGYTAKTDKKNGREISVLGLELPFIMLRFDLLIGSKTVVKFATIATDRDSEQESSVEFKLKEFGTLQDFETARLVVTLCETMPKNPYFISNSTKKVVLRHEEVQPSLVLNSGRPNRLALPRSSIFLQPANVYRFQWESGANVNLQVTDGNEAPSFLTVHRGNVANNLDSWRTSGGYYKLLEDMSLMDSLHSPFGVTAGFKRRLNVLGIRDNDPNPLQMISNGLKFRFAPSYIRDRITYQIGVRNDAPEDGGINFRDGADGVRLIGSEYAQCDFWLDTRYYHNVPASGVREQRDAIVSLTSTSRSSQTTEEIDIDILDALFNEDGKVKIGYLLQEDFDLPKNFNGGTFMCVEVEPIVNELSLTWKGYPAFTYGGDSPGEYGTEFIIISRNLYDSSRSRYTSLEDAVGYSVIAPNININAKIKINYITVTAGETRVRSFDIPIVRLLPNSQYYSSIASYYMDNTDLGDDVVNRTQLGISVASTAQSLGRGSSPAGPFYYHINNMRSWFKRDEADLIAKRLVDELKVSSFYYVLKDISIEIGDILFLVQEEGNSLLTQVREWEGITESYGEEDAIHSYDVKLGTLHDSWSKFETTADRITTGSDIANARFPLSELMTNDYFLFYNWSSSSLNEGDTDKIKNQRVFDDNLYSFHGDAYRTHRLLRTRFNTPTEALNSIYVDYHSKKRISVTGDAVGLEEDEVLTPLQYLPFRWVNRLEEVDSNDTRLLRPTEFVMSFGEGVRATVTGTENIRTSELDASLLFKSFGPGYDEAYN